MTNEAMNTEAMNTNRPKTVYLIPDGYREPPRLLTPEERESLFEHYPDTGWEAKLEPLRDMIRCSLVELVELPGLGELWIDEEGKLNDSLVNPVATALYVSAGVSWDLIVGRGVLIVDPSLDPEKAELILREAWSRITEYRKVAEGSLN